ncbi:MAG: PHP domain-containing protein [Dehalococcoidia bacterium]|nr:PHP domain-containing protein [Dehalococcoidia bacterium]
MNEEFLKADLHIHTPGSVCCSERSVTAEDIVDTAVQAGLDIIAVTDHNSVSYIDAVRSAAHSRNLLFFPGMELSARGGHVLALFDPATPSGLLKGLLDRLGIPVEARGDAGFTIEWIEDIFRIVHEWGGVPVAAHIERWPTGFLETAERRDTKARIYRSPYLAALEITQAQKKGQWTRGEIKHYAKSHACIQASDAHALEDIGRRITYLKLPSLDLEGLRTAFREHEHRIRFPEEMDHAD